MTAAVRRVALVNETGGHENWGCAATSAGLRALVTAAWPDAEVEIAPAETLWPRDVRLLRGFTDRAILRVVRDGGGATPLAAALRRYGFDAARLARADVAVFNGEGMIHQKSGHVVRLIGAMALAQRLGKRVLSINQTVDVRDGAPAEMVRLVYPRLDRVLAREPQSVAALAALGVRDAALFPDAAFAAPWPQDAALAPVRMRWALPDRFVAVTGSSALSHRDPAPFEALLEALRATFGLPMVVLASAKTDKRLGARAAAAHGDVSVVDERASFQDAMAIIGGADALAGGRFHPMIFAARVGTPLLPLGGNTFKNAGLMALLDYPVAAIDWRDTAGMRAAATRLAAEAGPLGAALRAAAQAAAARMTPAALRGDEAA